MTAEEYHHAIRELARATTMPAAAVTRVEQELTRTSATVPVETPGRRAAWVLAAAAAIVLCAGVIAWYARRQLVTVNDVTIKAPPVAMAASDGGTGDVAPQPRKTAENRARPRVVGSRRAVIHPAGFFPVPAAAALPQFESGVIVRLTLPVAVLPSYGIDISPASSAAPVEADVLVGQDGMARAIRLVNSSRSQQ